MKTQNVYIFDAVRTPRARRKGKFTSVHPADLMTYPLSALMKRNNITPEVVDDVLVGCVTQTLEQGWCVGRQSVLASGWTYKVPATTINRLCGSGQQAFNFAAMGVACGEYDLVVAGGLEHMTRVPMFSDIGGEESSFLKKHYPDLVQQGVSAEMVAEKFKISRSELDKYSYESHMKAKKAQEEGRFRKSLVEVEYKVEDGAIHKLVEDDTIRKETTIEALSTLKTVFKENGVITAGNASAIVDGSAAILIGNEEQAKKFNLKPRARVVAMTSIGSEPKIMLTGPIEASQKVLKRAGLKLSDIDVWEINEAFAPVPLATIKELEIDPSKVNVNGGGISLGHPLGATGAMLLGTALDELERTQKRYALVTMCIGLGMGISTIIERL